MLSAPLLRTSNFTVEFQREFPLPGWSVFWFLGGDPGRKTLGGDPGRKTLGGGLQGGEFLGFFVPPNATWWGPVGNFLPLKILGL